MGFILRITMRILLATNNKGKAREIHQIITSLDPEGIEIILPSDLNIQDSPTEDGPDYLSNAIIKAEFYGKKCRMITIADDSGLEVDALDGFPGIKSARVKAPENTDKSRYEILLEMMNDIEPSRRSARFVCVAVAYLPPDGRIISARGEWEGIILEKPDGEGGFGYDPVFFDPMVGKSAANMSVEEKNLHSHRGKAFRELWEKIIIG
jgi:XTP/dITP diphosphohydrolase